MEVRNETGKKNIGGNGNVYTWNARLVLEIMGLGQGIKRRTFGDTDQGNVWENEKMRTGEPGKGWRKDKERLKMSQKRENRKAHAPPAKS